MTKAFIAGVLRDNSTMPYTEAVRLATKLIESIVADLRQNGRFVLPTFGSFKVAKRKAHKALNPRTGERIKVKADKTVRFKASPHLRKSV